MTSFLPLIIGGLNIDGNSLALVVKSCAGLLAVASFAGESGGWPCSSAREASALAVLLPSESEMLAVLRLGIEGSLRSSIWPTICAAPSTMTMTLAATSSDFKRLNILMTTDLLSVLAAVGFWAAPRGRAPLPSLSSCPAA